MKKLFLAFGISGLLFTACVSNPEGEKAETTEAADVAALDGTELPIKTDVSKVFWLGKKVSGQHNGDIQIKSGYVTVAGEQLTGGKFVLDMNTINNLDLEGEWKGKLEGHLKNEDFFNVATFPEATLEITNVAGSGVATVDVSANLTIKDITKNITFKANVTEISETSFKANADFNIKRADWGVTYEGQKDDLISEEINFKVDLTAGN